MSKLKVSAATDALDPNEIQIGRWCWVGKPDDKNRWFGCVTHVGTNYVLLTAPGGSSSRVHFQKFWKCCEPVANADEIIADHLATAQDKLDSLLSDVKTLTASLAIGPNPALQGSGETQALVVATAGRSYKEYSKELVAAKKTSLPKLFEQIEQTTKALKRWMSAKIVPLKAQADGLHELIEHVETRIFNVELYAGLVEEACQIRKGDPAPLTTPVHLLQRRHYMDEECLAQYEVGGMDYKSIEDFDRWLCRADNFERLLPFPRCVIAFRVRRHEKHREARDIADFVRIMDELEYDKLTFLYVRNGESAYRISTEIEFDEELFPDLDRAQLRGTKLWAKDDFGGDRKFKIITDNERTGMIESYNRELAEWKAETAAYEAALKSPEALGRAKQLGLKKPDHRCINLPWPGSFGPSSDHGRYERYDRENVYYDDITKQIGRDIQKHNRIALILQGLLDRSKALHPHPPWQLWTDEGFAQGVVLVHDQSRAIPSGAPPDFEAYRAELAATLRAGSVTYGQDRLWARAEAEKLCARSGRDLYAGEHRPYGNPGPGKLARPVHVSRTGVCTFEWLREPRTEYDGDGRPRKGKILTRFKCKAADLFHVSEYKPGDFKRFFSDPRTRADYLKWAPPMLQSEEYHAGNVKVREPIAERPVRKTGSLDGRRRYEQQRRRKLLLGKAVRLQRQIETKGGKRHEKGTLWRVCSARGVGFNVCGINTDGSDERDPSGNVVRWLTGLGFYDLEIDHSVPAEPAEKEDDQ